MQTPKELYEKGKDRIKKYMKDGTISEQNGLYVLSLLRKLDVSGLDKYGYPRKLKYTTVLSTLCKMHKDDYNKITKQELENLILKIRNRYTGETPRDFLVMLRIFIKSIKQDNGEEFEKNQFPKIVSWIEPGHRIRKDIPISDILTENDIKKLSEKTTNLRDRALILLLYETGCRIGELMNIKNKDIRVDDYGLIIRLEGKTGVRHVRIVKNTSTIQNWFRMHPRNNDSNASFFCNIWSKKEGEPMTYNNIADMLKTVFRKTGIIKPHNPHHFRHSRATQLGYQLNEVELCTFFGWVVGSKEVRTYVHRNEEVTNDRILELSGITVDKSKKLETKDIKEFQTDEQIRLQALEKELFNIKKAIEGYSAPFPDKEKRKRELMGK